MLVFALLLSAAADPACDARKAIAVNLVVTGDEAEPVRAALTSRLASACVAIETPDATKKLQRIYPVTVDVTVAPVGTPKPGFPTRTFQVVTKTSGADARGR